MKQRIAFREVLKGAKIGAAMIKAGYAKTTATSTGHLTSKDSWKQMMKQYLPDSKLAERHRELLDKKETILTSKKVGDQDVYEVLEQPDTHAVSKALDMAYKLKQRYSDAPPGDTIINIFSNEQLRRAAEAYIRSRTVGQGKPDIVPMPDQR